MNPRYSTFVPGDVTDVVGPYLAAAQGCTDQDILVQVGVGFGRATCFMTELLADAGKRPHFYAIDLFGTTTDADDGEPLAGLTPWGEPFADWSRRVGGDWRMIDWFDFYLTGCPTADRLTDWVQFPPWHSSEEFSDGSVYFCHLNATPGNPAQVDRQIEKWRPKIRPGGRLLIAGREAIQL